ncbi:MAG: SGNH/GDSL hydrolase family protein [Rhodospirillales bacterium]
MKKWLKVAGVNALVLIAGLLIAELVFGNWLFGPDYRQMNIPRNTVRVFDVDTLYPGGGSITYTRDEHGLRGHYKNVGDIDILTLGGSTTNQLYVDDEKTWQAVLGRAFAGAGRDISVVNAAVDGQSTRGHIAVFERWFPLIEGLQADRVLVYAGINDIAVTGHEQYDEMRSPDPARRFSAAIKNKSAVYELYKVIRGVLAAHDAHVVHGDGPRTGLTWEKWQPAGRDFEALPELADRLQAYEGRLRTLTKKIRDFGAEAIYVTQPSADFRIRDGWIWLPAGKERDEAEQYFRQLDAFNRMTMRVCRELGAICIDLARGLSFEDADFYDRVHNTDTGAAKVGQYLFEALKDRL